MNKQDNLIEQRMIAQNIRILQEKLVALEKSQRAAGWAQRNSVITHVYSDYREQENLLKSKGKWERISFELTVLKDLLDLLISYRDIYGIYDTAKMKIILKGQIKLAEEKEEFEIAHELLQIQERLFDLRLNERS